MNASRLLEHFDRISEAPDAIPKLRKFILDLAVRGKLVEQDSGETPASELLAELGARNGRSRQESAPADPIDAEDEPFGVPSGWQWCRFADIARIESRLVSPKDHPDSPHIAPDNIEGVKVGDRVYFHVTNLEQDWDVPHGFAVKGARNSELLIMPGETCTLKWVPDRVGVVAMYCTDFCSALHQEMQGYVRVSPRGSNTPLTFSTGKKAEATVPTK